MASALPYQEFQSPPATVHLWHPCLTGTRAASLAPAPPHRLLRLTGTRVASPAPLPPHRVMRLTGTRHWVDTSPGRRCLTSSRLSLLRLLREVAGEPPPASFTRPPLVWVFAPSVLGFRGPPAGKTVTTRFGRRKALETGEFGSQVATAIQFYDLQDRLGFDQPSKAVEWLIKAARDAIDELPSLNGAFPETPRQQNDERRPGLGGGGGNNAEQGFDSSAELELDGDPGFTQTQQQHGSNLSRSSACSSNSETSKGSGGLSLSRNEIRVKARERARERTAKEKTESNTQNNEVNHHLSQNQQSTSSFTQLLTAGIGNMGNAGVNSSSMDNYFNATGLMGASSSARGGAVPHQILHLGDPGIHQAMMTVSPFNIVGGESQNQNQNHHHHHELQHFPFVTDHQFVVSGASGSTGDHYNLNFSISPSSSSGALAAGFNNRGGTLQSNSSQSLLPQLQRFSSSQLDGTTMPFFLGTAVDHQHHQHAAASLFPPGLQLYYGDGGGRQSDQKGKGKN